MAARRTELNPRPSTETPLLEDARSAFTDNSASDEREDELCSFSCGALCRCFGLCWVADAEKHDAMEANKMIGRLGVWLAANTFLFACQRVAVACGLPYDGHKGWKNARWSLTAPNHLCLYASGAAVFAHALTPRRAGRLFGKPANCAAFLGVALGVGVLFSIVSDISFAAHVLVANGDSWEFHHYWLAWIASLFCPFDHPASVFCLAATTGIFGQGVAAYGAAEIFTKGSS
ncbi:hypothetical protein JL721_12098 [Aureococcus anophagefferens]|nr:hypothetical protein JL721_12098 [Aureococcus anophagefferens]